jgi:hypothetical protein
LIACAKRLLQQYLPQTDSCTQQTTGLFDHLVGANATWAQKSYDIEGGIRLLAGPLQVQ